MSINNISTATPSVAKNHIKKVINEASATMVDRFAVHDKPGSERDLLLEH